MSGAGVVVVGAGLAGLRAAEALRRGGYEGTVTVLGEEPLAPYDRPPLSKQLLTGKVGPHDVALREEEGLDIDWRLGCGVVALDVERRRLDLDDGDSVEWSGLVIATGARARHLPGGFGLAGGSGLARGSGLAGGSALPGGSGLAGVHVLRTLADAVALRAELEAGPRVAVIGGSFIGSEVASSCRSLGLEVSVIDAVEVPLARAVGDEMGRACAQLHTDNGTDLRLGVGVESLVGAGHIEGVRLLDGAVIPADVLVVGIGVVPNVEWLEGSGVELDNGVVCDQRCRVMVGGRPRPDMVAAGDVARWHHPGWGHSARVEHWTNAVEQAEAAAHVLLRGDDAPAYAPTPYFWSDQYGKKLQFVGHTLPGDDVLVVDGDVRERKFVACYGRQGRMVAALGMSRPAKVMHYQREIAGGAPFPPVVS